MSAASTSIGWSRRARVTKEAQPLCTGSRNVHAGVLEYDFVFQDLAHDLTAVTFSLWRAVFLSDLTGDLGNQLADMRRFLRSLIAHNTVLYQTDFTSREWAISNFAKAMGGYERK